MCGICGILLSDREARVDPTRLERMRDSMAARGPDDAGLLVEGALGLGHRRLSILDTSSRGHQPMASESGRHVIVYNGEIYNFPSLKRTLEAAGRRFRTGTDTEVLLAGLDTWGLDALLPRLDGIFAFAAWDRHERQLLLARDPLGVKPLFWAETREGFLFASEIKGLWAAGVERSADPDHLEELLLFRFVAGQVTPFRNVTRLLPGHSMVVDARGRRARAYWRATDHVARTTSPAAWQQRFVEAVQAQRISDVPLGTLLSGGLDSSALTAELARVSGPIKTFTVSLPSSEGLDEAPYAAAVAQRWGCEAHVLRVAAGDALERLRVAQRAHDEPLAHGSDMQLLELSREAKRHVSVLLSGEGADETLAGYVRYQPLRAARWLGARGWRVAGALALPLTFAPAHRARKLGRLLALGSLEHALLYDAADVLPRDLTLLGLRPRADLDARREILREAALSTPDPLRQVLLYDLQTFLCSILDRNDRMTMAASIECRVPFLAVGVVEAALGLPRSALFSGMRGKKVLRDLAAPLLPREVLQRPKWGFGMPWDRYLRTDPACRAVLARLPGSGLADALGAPRLRELLARHRDGDRTDDALVRQLFALSVWWDEVASASAA